MKVEISQPKVLILNYPQRREEILSFVRRHHYTRRCPGVWQVCYALSDERTGKLKCVNLMGQPPYPSIARSFVYGGPDHEKKIIWQARLVGAGVSSAELDSLLAAASQDLLARGYWWLLTFTDPNAHTIDDFSKKIVCKGFTGEVYHRNGFLPVGTTGKSSTSSGGSKRRNAGKNTKQGPIAGWIIDNQEMVHCRQGPVTLTQSNIRQHYPQAKSIRSVRALPKQRWVYILANTELERAERIRLMRHRPQADWQPLFQPRMFRIRGLRIPLLIFQY